MLLLENDLRSYIGKEYCDMLTFEHLQSHKPH